MSAAEIARAGIIAGQNKLIADAYHALLVAREWMTRSENFAVGGDEVGAAESAIKSAIEAMEEWRQKRDPVTGAPVFRIAWMTAPMSGHVYCRVFVAAAPGQTYAALGNLTVRKSEWEHFKRAFAAAEFVEETAAGGETA